MADCGLNGHRKGRRCVWLAATNGNRGEKKKKKGCGSKRAVANLGMSCERRPGSRKRLGHVISISRGSCSSCPSAAARRRCSSNIIYKRRIHARAAAAAKMLATLTVGECSARRGQILPRDGGEQQQQRQRSAVTGSSSARGLQYFCEQHSWSVGRSVAFFSFFSRALGKASRAQRPHKTHRLISPPPWDAPP